MSKKQDRPIWREGTAIIAALLLMGTAPVEVSPETVALSNYEALIGLLKNVEHPDDYVFVVDQLKSLILFYPDWPEPYYSLGTVLEKQGRFAEAAESFRTYLELKPHARDSGAVTSMIAGLDAKARRGLNREVVTEMLVALGDTAIWRRTSGDEEAARFIPVFRRTAQGLDAEVESDGKTHALQKIAVSLSDDTRAFWVRYVVQDYAPPLPGYSCGGKALCDYAVTATITVESEGAVDVELVCSFIYDSGLMLNNNSKYIYFKR